MKALSIRQPWAWLIVNGYKPVENRTWETFYRGPVLIHAGLGMTHEEYESCARFLLDDERRRHVFKLLPPAEKLERGGIVGQAEVVACTRMHESPFFTGPFGHVLANASPLPFLALKGALGYFTPPPAAIAHAHIHRAQPTHSTPDGQQFER